MTLEEAIAAAKTGRCMSIRNRECQNERDGKRGDYMCPSCRREYDRSFDEQPEMSAGQELEAEVRRAGGGLVRTHPGARFSDYDAGESL